MRTSTIRHANGAEPHVDAISEPALAVTWVPPRRWHQNPAARPSSETKPIEVHVIATGRTSGRDDGPHPLTIAETDTPAVEIGSMIMLERDRKAARRNDGESVRFARVDYVGTVRDGRRLLHVRWFRERQPGLTTAAPEPLRG